MGKKRYETACMICHQASGLGTPGQFPPLVGSEWVTGPLPRLIRIPMHGVTGPIKVAGTDWNLSMPNAGGTLSDKEMAALLTYLRLNWGNKASEVMDEDVKKARAKDGGRSTPWTSQELLALPEKE
jgi:mono/diheme cytochrome c family protein